MKRRTFLFSAAAALLIAATPHAWAVESPKDIVERFYIVSAGANKKWDGPSAFNMNVIRKTVFSKALRQAVSGADARNRKDEPGWLDFDPISNSQDPNVKGLRVSVVRETAAQSTIRADFRAEEGAVKTPNRVEYDFVFEDGEWKLDDIRDPKKEGWSIRALTKAAMAAPKS